MYYESDGGMVPVRCVAPLCNKCAILTIPLLGTCQMDPARGVQVPQVFHQVGRLVLRHHPVRCNTPHPCV